MIIPDVQNCGPSSRLWRCIMCVVILTTLFPNESLAVLKPLTSPNVRLNVDNSIRLDLLIGARPTNPRQPIKLACNHISGSRTKAHWNGVTNLSILLRRCARKLPVIRELLNPSVFSKR